MPESATSICHAPRCQVALTRTCPRRCEKLEADDQDPAPNAMQLVDRAYVSPPTGS